MSNLDDYLSKKVYKINLEEERPEINNIKVY